MALGGKLGTIFPEIFLQVVIPVVQRIDDVRRGSCSHAAPDDPVIKNNYFLPRTRQRVCDGQSGYSRSDDTDVGASVLTQRIQRLRGGGRFPERYVSSSPVRLIFNGHTPFLTKVG